MKLRFLNSAFGWMMLAVVVALGAAAPAAEGRLSDDPADRLSTVPHHPELEAAVKASELRMVSVQHEGWRETLATFSRLKMHELTGRKSIHGQDPMFSVLSMIYTPAHWYDAKILPVEHPRVNELLGGPGKWVSPNDLINGGEKTTTLINEVRAGLDLQNELRQLKARLDAVQQVNTLGRESRVLTMFESKGISRAEIESLLDSPEKLSALKDEFRAKTKSWNDQRAFVKAGEKLLGRVNMLTSLPEQLLVVPDADSVDERWVRPVGMATATTKGLAQAGHLFHMALAEAFMTGNPEHIAPATTQFLSTVGKSRLYPKENYRRMYNTYEVSNPWKVAGRVYLLGAVAAGFWFFFRKGLFYWTALGAMAIGFFFHTSGVGLRAYLTGHVPVSNMFESLTFMSWSVLLIALVFEAFQRRGIVALGSMIIGFLFLTGAGMMPLHDTRLHPLRAVLDSYWLNIHVTMMLVSYAAFAIAAFFAALYMVRHLLGRESLFGGEAMMSQVQTEEFAYRLVQVGWPILTFGVTLGAVWADTAWGRYWGWDPKETWAFITWCAFTIYLHMRMVMGWRGVWSACACLVGFLMVMITWLGVSYLPWFAGGLHTYASPL